MRLRAGAARSWWFFGANLFIQHLCDGTSVLRSVHGCENRSLFLERRERGGSSIVLFLTGRSWLGKAAGVQVGAKRHSLVKLPSPLALSAGGLELLLLVLGVCSGPSTEAAGSKEGVMQVSQAQRKAGSVRCGMWGCRGWTWWSRGSLQP